jgi:hypothetical protein
MHTVFCLIVARVKDESPAGWSRLRAHAVRKRFDVIDLREEWRAALVAWRDLLRDIVAEAVRYELGRWQRGDPDELVDAEVAARILGVKSRALRRAAERGQSPARVIRVGRRLRWRRGDLLALAQKEKA